MNKAICTFLSACVQKTAQADQEENFEEVLALKDRLFKATGAKIVPQRLHWEEEIFISLQSYCV